MLLHMLKDVFGGKWQGYGMRFFTLLISVVGVGVIAYSLGDGATERRLMWIAMLPIAAMLYYLARMVSNPVLQIKLSSSIVMLIRFVFVAFDVAVTSAIPFAAFQFSEDKRTLSIILCCETASVFYGAIVMLISTVRCAIAVNRERADMKAS